MADRKQFQTNLVVTPRMKRLLGAARKREVSEETLREQQVSWVYGNALDSELITKESAREACQRIRLVRPPR